MVMAATVVLGAALAGRAEAAPPTPAQKCQEQKLKAQGKLQLCLKKNSAKVIGGKPDASAACQTKFSAALTKAGTACHYLDNGDGTVSDLNNGLVWEKKAVTCAGSHCFSDAFTWCSGTFPNCTNSADPPDGTAFTTFLYGLNGGTSPDGVATSGCFTGHCDWRVPTIEELRGIVDVSAAGCGSGSPCIDPVFGPTQALDYWSATTDARVPTFAWLVFFTSGTGVTGSKTFNHYVRAVRGGL
jgi:hypothetical protein